jgi:hypothetical protein
MNCSDFTYLKSFQIPYCGCSFDSLLEVKFALSIENDYRFLRSPVKIGYNPKTLQTTNYFRETTRVYTPDFLIRHKLTHEAWLIELKPTAYQLSKNVSIYNSIAMDYIRKQGLDWSFNVIFGSEIHLEADKLNKFRMFAMRKTTFQSKFDFQKMDQKYNRNPVNIFSSIPAFNREDMTRAEYSHWVRRGI